MYDYIRYQLIVSLDNDRTYRHEFKAVSLNMVIRISIWNYIPDFQNAYDNADIRLFNNLI